MPCSSCPQPVRRATEAKPTGAKSDTIRATLRSQSDVDALIGQYPGYTAHVQMLSAKSYVVTLTRKAK